jgi:hypothetical protein
MPHDIIAPKRTEQFTICGHIRPHPIYVGLKSKKNLQKKRANVSTFHFIIEKDVKEHKI